jgi:putative PIN family toxin of toxin-antitoxin system
MANSGRFVFDTNVIVSALLFEHSKPGIAFYAALARGQVLLSLPVVHELDTVLNREKFDRYVLREEREQFLAALIHAAIFVEPIESVQACRDPHDDVFLELALAGEATTIVSGDDDLLALSPFRGIPILTPDQFLAFLAAED